MAAEDDADKDIVSFAVQKLQYIDVTIFGDDTDLIILILHNAERIEMSYNTL